MATEKENKNVVRLATAFLFILGLLYVIDSNSRTALGIYIVFTLISLVIYAIKVYIKTSEGISSKGIVKLAFIAGAIGLGFYALTRFIPGLSFGLPLLPNTISDELRFFIVVVIAPIGESLFFLGLLLGFIRNFNPSKSRIALAVILQALAFALYHVAAYISGFANLPNLLVGLSSLLSNISGFISAFIFGIISGFLVVKYKNLWVGIFLHLILNLIIYTALTIALVGLVLI